MLQKSRLYDRLAADPLQQYGTEEAAIDAMANEKEAYLVDFLLKEDHADGDTRPELPAAVTKDEWTEYTDEFGRARLVRRTELEAMAQHPLPSEGQSPSTNDHRTHHYDAASEIRAKAVGYFKLSMDEAARAEQLDELSKLRNSVPDQLDCLDCRVTCSNIDSEGTKATSDGTTTVGCC